MSEVWIDAQVSPPLSARCYVMVPGSPAWLGAAIAVLYLGVCGVFFTAAGVSPQGEALADRAFWQTPGWWALVVNAVLMGFAPTVLVYVLRSAERDVRTWRPCWAARRRRSTRASARSSGSIRSRCARSARRRWW